MFFQWRPVTVCDGLSLRKKIQVPRNFPNDWEFLCSSLDVHILYLWELLFDFKGSKGTSLVSVCIRGWIHSFVKTKGSLQTGSRLSDLFFPPYSLYCNGQFFYNFVLSLLQFYIRCLIQLVLSL